jgi:ketosteroid isomerase-like protein
VSEDPELNRKVVSTMLEAVRDGDLESAMGVVMNSFDPDIVVHQAGSLPYGGVHAGREQVLRMFGAMRPYVDTHQLGIDRVLADGESVVALLRMRWVLPDGERCDMAISEWYRFAGGKVVEIKPFWFDTALLRAVPQV